MKYQTIPYRTRNGSCPVREFIFDLNPKDREKLLRALMLLEHFGLGVGAPLIKHLDSGIFEVRSHVGNNHQRVLLFHWHENYLVLLHGFTKKTQKTPPLEIERAKRYRADFLIRYSTDRILEILAEEEKQS